MSDVLFNDNWQFVLKEIGTPFDEMEREYAWSDVELPHDWLIEDTARLYETGEGWYKKEFDVIGYGNHKAYILRFDGVYMNSTVYVNGTEVGTWKYGYSSFNYDISAFLHEGKNRIHVRVCHEAPNTRWYSGAGIYRNVYLRTTSRIHIKENGVYISSKKIGERWLTRIETETSHDGCLLRHTVLNRRGIPVAIVEGEVKDCFSRVQIWAEEPFLWSIEDPYCYKLKTELLLDGVILDRVENEFGFRTIEFSPENGFLLNGVRTKLHGVCMHHDLGALGAAMNTRALERQLEILKSFGVNAIRTSHNMPARELIELCDHMGFLVDNEGFDMWELPKNDNDYARFFPEWYERDVKAWVERDRNAPCVILWSIGNEILDTHQSARGLEVAKMLCKAVYRSDKYGNARCTIGSNYMRWGNAQKVADYLKLSGYNYTEDVYDEHHAAHPDWFIYGSETASTVRSRGVYHMPASVPLLTHDDQQCSDYGNSIVGWGKSQEQAWIDDRDRDYCGGQFVWTGFDYIGEPTPYSTKNSYFGIVDTAGFPKNAYYFYKAVWTDGESEPFVHILPYWDFNIGEEVDVFVYSNVETIELFYNNRSCGRQQIDLKHGKRLHGEWKLPYKKGTLIACAYDKEGNRVAESSACSFGDAAEIAVSADQSTFLADGRDLIFLEISVKDEMGITVENARNRIRVSVNGPARLVGLDNGDSTDYDSYKGRSRRLFGGKLLAMIQSTFETGTVTVTFESEGLPKKTIVLEALKCEKPVGVSVVKRYFLNEDEEEVSDIPVRKIELSADRTALDTENPSARIRFKIYPPNATYSDIEWKCVLDNGVSIGTSEIAPTESGAVVTALGDGNYRIRASCRNGGSVPQVISELTFTNSGFGSALHNPFSFISASLYSSGSEPLNTIARGAIGGIRHRTVIGYDRVDFGSEGSNRLILSCGHSGDSTPIPIEVWLGEPGEGGEILDVLDFKNNGLWDSFAPQEFTLSKRITGIRTITFVISEPIIFGGFEFERRNKAYEQLGAANGDSLYGDDYRIEGESVLDIGNNVLISFNGLDFTDGTERVTICGRTPNEVNAIQLRFSDENGNKTTQLLDFPYSDEDEIMTFPLDERIVGKNDVSFVFLPGCRFDFRWFRFE
ncbi:MAG: DUF4982 domain-containing protein [Bacteroides sp.]|nr:DUF4982 domain-containing protein [Eubacterium sp.]MCM1417277.1 DUF4982 domain-containing protein [Roseburia sp.]MCM1461103.1 DUF4982 domain-containing protein [Bacteroides sp.]